jgi:undecaprenyl pyrophosphate synthase
MQAMPRHVAIIMDGNARWAAERGLPAGAGHERGVDALRRMVRCCGAWGGARKGSWLGREVLRVTGSGISSFWDQGYGPRV